MASAGLVAYNPDDPAQAGFLAALAQGETGGAANSASLGTGQTNLSGLATDQYGFPQWTGLGNSHAAGTFQFQPGTWDAIASKFNLNFQNPQDGHSRTKAYAGYPSVSAWSCKTNKSASTAKLDQLSRILTGSKSMLFMARGYQTTSLMHLNRSQSSASKQNQMLRYAELWLIAIRTDRSYLALAHI